MKKQTPTRPCSSCLQPQDGMVVEVFADNSSAFVRHAELVQVGHAPSLCIKRDGTCFVCHFGQAAS